MCFHKNRKKNIYIYSKIRKFSSCTQYSTLFLTIKTSTCYTTVDASLFLYISFTCACNIINKYRATLLYVPSVYAKKKRKEKYLYCCTGTRHLQTQVHGIDTGTKTNDVKKK